MSERAQLFVGRLNKDTRVKDLEGVFNSYGRMIRCDIKYGVGTAYAFVDFDDRRDAEDAIKYENGRTLLGNRIVVEYAKGRSYKPPRIGSSQDECYKCHRTGHWARDCAEDDRYGGRRSRSPSRGRRRKYSRSRSRSDSRKRDRSRGERHSKRNKSRSRDRGRGERDREDGIVGGSGYRSKRQDRSPNKIADESGKRRRRSTRSRSAASSRSASPIPRKSSRASPDYGHRKSAGSREGSTARPAPKSASRSVSKGSKNSWKSKSKTGSPLAAPKFNGDLEHNSMMNVAAARSKTHSPSHSVSRSPSPHHSNRSMSSRSPAQSPKHVRSAAASETEDKDDDDDQMEDEGGKVGSPPYKNDYINSLPATGAK